MVPRRLGALATTGRTARRIPLIILPFPHVHNIVKKNFRLTKLLLPAMAMQLALLAACDDDTAAIGTTVMPGQDLVSTAQKTYAINTATVRTDSVLANTNDSYLGCVIDPETRAKTTCNFLAQFNVLEDSAFPDRNKMLTDDKGNLIIDSCRVRVFINSYYGDSLTTMKLTMQELDTNKVIKENTPYYTNLDADEFLTEGKGVKRTVSYAVRDLSRPDSATSSNYRSIVIDLPTSYGRFLADQYYAHPEYYSNSYQFIHHVCPGFYFKSAGGVGSMICAQTTTLDVYFRYHTTNEAGRDTIAEGMQRMAATEEVIQQTMTDNSIPDNMLDPDNGYTYLKSPAGLYTEVTLPVGDIVAGEHYTDTINSATLTFARHNSGSPSSYNLETPANVVLLRKSKAKEFFENNRLTNGIDSYIATFDNDYNAYTFSNISVLITRLKEERDRGAGVSGTDTEAERNTKYAAWEAANPDWNKLSLIPVAAEYTTTTNSYGYTTKTLLNIKNLLGMYSVKLMGGNSGKISLNVIYSRFAK